MRAKILNPIKAKLYCSAKDKYHGTVELLAGEEYEVEDYIPSEYDVGIMGSVLILIPDHVLQCETYEIDNPYLSGYDINEKDELNWYHGDIEIVEDILISN